MDGQKFSDTFHFTMVLKHNFNMWGKLQLTLKHFLIDFKIFIEVNVDEDKVITQIYLKEQDWLDYLFDLMSDGLNLDPDWLSQGRPGSNITKLFRSVIY